MDTMLRGFWYIAASGPRLKPGQTLPVTLLGQTLLLVRAADGTVTAFEDACPHRGMPMRHGTFDGTNLQCSFHGWAFRATDGLATATIVDAGGVSRSLPHILTDYPGHFPNGSETLRALVRAGADVNVRLVGPNEETPLHWAASNDDVAVIDALLELSADLEAGYYFER